MPKVNDVSTNPAYNSLAVEYCVWDVRMTQGDDLRQSLERLVKLGQTPDVDIRPVLLRVLVDLFVCKEHHAPADLHQFEGMMQHLLDDADADVRQIVAEKLAPHAATPQSLLDRFLGYGGAIAVPVLEHTSVDQETLLEIANWGLPATARAIAGRGDLSPNIATALAGRPEPDILLALARNAAAPLDRSAFQYLVRRSHDDEDLARALLGREGFPADRAALFLFANSEQRAAIMLAARRDDLSPEVRRVRLSPDETTALTGVERAILSPDRDGFDTALAIALHLPLSDIWRLIDDPKGEPLALALAAIGASVELAARVFILSGPAIGHSVMAVRMLTTLVETMPRQTASRLISAMTHSAARHLRHTIAKTDAASRGQSLEDGRSLARPAARPANEPQPRPERKSG